MPSVPYPSKPRVSSAMGSEPSGEPAAADTQASPHGAPPATRATSTALLRLYNPDSGDHLYTTSVTERDTAVARFGYTDEGVAGHVSATAATGTTPLLRLYNPDSGDHLYTASVTERDTAVARFGYVDEGIACHVFATAGAGTAPLLRVYNPSSMDHFYTASAAERDTAVARLGYVDEGVACHVYPN
ncbi:hypothetical protein F4553_001894 [Allocatelliglobosispora scoriae]|uniref:DUF5648 domain-containing protein n=2 Tax=Allocatelliglobosispora scoriae TaxID=643052 RepID=A0A841BLJ8_9ACTN|nr:hypothetical protein [Allocatelliglobosispora scoriae]